ncbi:GNAT family N-acetyltransferase [Streptomyces bauhiniae]|uniref:GNAT family N-acetyltransferase n=1 Tax=Streptomyces bauhiniae TaxID=2340725 RepID=A0A7K3QKM4_9ACTN|nr:GNAT family N-acetyltransferase [Streptomyces bauhiniae]NEB90447.1 GNAT family N-acetyltransferase [Streptomyces bauhiniae]
MSETWTVELPGERVLLREPGPADETALLNLFEECEDWFTAATGLPSAPGDVQSLYYALPEGADPGDKVLLLVERGGEVAGLVDAVRDWPRSGEVAVGLFLLAPWARGRGLGRAIAETLLARGASRVTATVPAGWKPGERFLEELGFTLEAPAGALRRAEWLRGS